jgi:putative ABC transport system permease protein
VTPASPASPSLSALWRIARRDLSARIRGLRLLAICLFLGVATLAAIGSLTHGITAELAARGQAILGGDVEVELPQREASAEEQQIFQSLGATSSTVRMRAMANADGQNALLTELKAVDSAYPLYGNFRLTSGQRSGPPPSGTVWIAADLAQRMNLSTGQRVAFGEKSFRIDGIIDAEPDRLGEGFTIGPVAIINIADLPATQLIQPGSLFAAKYRIRLPAAVSPADARKTLEAQSRQRGWDVKDASNGAPGTRRFIERMGQFLSLVGLAALVIAGIGVGNGVSSYLAGKRASLATLKVLGADSAAIARIYGLQIAVIAAASIAAGLIAGALAPPLIASLAGDILPIAPGVAIYPLPLIISAAYGVLIALAFALPPLAAARRIPAAGLYRANVTASQRSDRRTVTAVLLAFTAVIALAVGSAAEPLFALAFSAAAAGLLLLLVGLGWLVQRWAARLPVPKQPLLRLALANLHRPGASTAALVVALGLGLTLFVTLAAIQTSITAEIRSTVPERAPSFFVLDIPRDRAADFRAQITAQDSKAGINLIPALRGNITEFGGTRVEDLDELPKDAWVLRGDRGLTYSAAIPNGSEVTQGEWWPSDYAGPPLVSLDEKAAATLGLKLGDTISVNILGVEVQARLANLRVVNWENFGLNYAMVFSPGTFDAAPHNMIATVAVDKSAEAVLARSLPQSFPSASLIQVRDVIGQVTNILTQMSQAIAAAASMAILAGVAVLIGAIAASRERRIYDSVILKLLGATRSQILGAQALEYAALSAILAVVALALGLAASAYVVTQVFEFAFRPDPLIVGITLVGGAGLSFLIGMAGSLPLLAAKPAQALRSL